MFKLIRNIAHDTLKKDGKWSRTSLTMFTAWLMVLFMAIFQLAVKGFDFNIFITFVAVSLGLKPVDAFSQQILNKHKKDE